MRIAILCNDRLGVPALQFLVQNRLVQAVATTDRSTDMIGIMKLVTEQARVPSETFTRKNFEAALLEWLKKYQPDVVLVKTFPFRIPASALSIPKHGFINFHYAPLPGFRGSNPLFWMLKEGITTGGVAVHRMDEQFDTGPLLLQQSVEFPPDSSFGYCSTLLGHAGAQLALQLVQGLQAGTLKETPQEQKEARWYGRPQASDLFIHWPRMDAASIKALINACNPWLKGAPTRWKGVPLNIADASFSDRPVPPDTLPGTVIALSDEEGLIVACRDKRALKIHVACFEEGFYGGASLARFGLKTGERLG